MHRTKKAAIILAAGKGKRMASDIPKVLHTINGRPMVEYVIDNVRNAGFADIVVVIGHKHNQVAQQLKGTGVDFVVQYEQHGTGHAVMCAQPKFSDFDGIMLVLAGDMPLVSADTIQKLTDTHIRSGDVATVLTVKLPDPAGYGRIVRDPRGNFVRIVEDRDADGETLKIAEVNTAIICFNAGPLFRVLKELKCDNEQGEYYLTDSIGIFSGRGEKVEAVIADDYHEGMGINSFEQLREVEEIIISRGQAIKKC